jgi:hypothetical protein
VQKKKGSLDIEVKALRPVDTKMRRELEGVYREFQCHVLNIA